MLEAKVIMCYCYCQRPYSPVGESEMQSNFKLIVKERALVLWNVTEREKLTQLERLGKGLQKSYHFCGLWKLSNS